MEKLSKAVLLFASALYAVGLLAQNVILATVGASDLVLLHARGIFIGIWVVLIFAAVTAIPVWALAPWFIPTSKEKNISALLRVLIASVAIILPASIFWLIVRIWFKESNVINLDGAWFVTYCVTIPAVLTAIGAMITWRERILAPLRWGRLTLLAALTCGFAVLYVAEASLQIVMMIPASCGGAKARFVRLVTKPEIGKILMSSGVQYTVLKNATGTVQQTTVASPLDQYLAITKPLQLIDETDSEVTIVLPLQNGSRTYYSSLDLKKSDIIAIMSAPSNGSEDDQRKWNNSSKWPPE
ncbi:MAG: hypothetical protein ABSC77_12805 [Terracidiphilus sp.]|jgi:hypothetical protein